MDQAQWAQTEIALLPTEQIALRPSVQQKSLSHMPLETLAASMARSKGVREWKIVTKHTFRNALLTVITVVGQGFISALAGAAVVERLFNIPGMGSLMVDSIEKRDYQVIQAITLLIAMLNVFINLIIDLIYGLADPRIRLD